jgi:hypothetical protein
VTFFQTFFFMMTPMVVDFPTPRPSRTIIRRFQNPRRSLEYHFPRKKVRSSLHLYTCNFYVTTAK